MYEIYLCCCLSLFSLFLFLNQWHGEWQHQSDAAEAGKAGRKMFTFVTNVMKTINICSQICRAVHKTGKLKANSYISIFCSDTFYRTRLSLTHISLLFAFEAPPMSVTTYNAPLVCLRCWALTCFCHTLCRKERSKSDWRVDRDGDLVKAPGFVCACACVFVCVALLCWVQVASLEILLFPLWLESNHKTTSSQKRD